MNQVFAGGLALIIALILWSSKKKSSTSSFLKSKKDSFSTSQGTSSLVIKKNSINHKKASKRTHKKFIRFSNELLRNSIEIRKELTKLISSNPDDRLLAIQIASDWNNSKAIPFFKRGLKDSDVRVVVAAAAAISSFKGKATYLQKKSQASRPPRNVSLMR